jgi:hypothetical protein
LRDLRLIRRVAGQELAALDQMIDACRDVVFVRAATQEERHLARNQVLARQRAELALDRHLAGVIGKALDLAGQAGRFGHVRKQRLDRAGPDRAEHALPIGFGKREIPHSTGPRRRPGRPRDPSGRPVRTVPDKVSLKNQPSPWASLLTSEGRLRAADWPR